MTMTRETKELTIVDARRELTKLPEKLGPQPSYRSSHQEGKTSPGNHDIGGLPDYLGNHGDTR
jgi:phage terminase small subunit